MGRKVVRSDSGSVLSHESGASDIIDEDERRSGISNGRTSQAASAQQPTSRRRRRDRMASAPKQTADVSYQSIIWTFLVVGVIMCGVDSFFIMKYVMDHHHEEEETHAAAVNVEYHSTAEEAASESRPVATNLLGKEPILKLLRDAGVNDLAPEKIDLLPDWSEVVRLYGAEPIVHGLDTCQAFQDAGDASDHFVSTAGTFNTGTNLMAELLIKNCHMPARMHKYGANSRGVRWQVLWGKHTPVDDEQFRLTHRTYNDSTLTAPNIFPAVTVRDPYKWMQSMCRHAYGAHWKHNATHCPNLIANDFDQEEYAGVEAGDTVPVTVKYAEFDRHHDTLVGFWNDWYKAYANAPFPRLLVRFEDVVFHPQKVTKLVCECAGGEMNLHKPFQFVVDSAKKGDHAHGKERTSYVDALIKYGTEKGRYQGFDPADLEYAASHLDPELMSLFGYKSKSSV